MTARITVISGPAGVGKGTVVRQLRKLHPEVWVSVSVTTRAPRPGEADGVVMDYYTQALNLVPTAQGFDMDYFGSMMMHFAPEGI